MGTPAKERVRKWRAKQKKSGGKGISIILDKDGLSNLKEIQRLCGTPTVAATINKALSVMGKLAEKEANNYKLLIMPKEHMSNSDKKMEVMRDIESFTVLGG
jgi:hypothetical protein